MLKFQRGFTGVEAIIVLLICIAVGSLVAGAMWGQDDATVARHNAAKAADNFEVNRRIVFYNSITDNIVLVTEGACSVEPGQLRTAVICRVGPNEYVTNFYGKSDNTVYFVEQLGAVKLNTYHYRRTFKPQSILPDIDFRGSSRALGDAVTPDSSD